MNYRNSQIISVYCCFKQRKKYKVSTVSAVWRMDCSENREWKQKAQGGGCYLPRGWGSGDENMWMGVYGVCWRKNHQDLMQVC